jgi:uncharacterized protein
MLLFEWDTDKARSNRKKHGVDFDEAASIFADPLSVTISDPQHSSPGDERFVTIGRSHAGRILVVVHSDQADTVRVISARPATRPERTHYETER